MKIIAYMVVKNDQFYIPMALQSILPYVHGVYIQDQMSDDGTWEEIMRFQRAGALIYAERIDTGSNERFAKDYDEPHFRSLAIKAAEAAFPDAEWILKCDADEIFTPFFFNSLAELEAAGKLAGINGIRVAGDRFISMRHRSVHPTCIEISPEGIPFVDPHTQLWRAHQGVKYISNPAMTGFFHPVLWPDPQPQLWLEGLANIHLHRTFGPKALAFWREGTDIIDPNKPLHPPTQAPNWYNSKVNMGNAEEVDFTWPEYVMEKWREWGTW